MTLDSDTQDWLTKDRFGDFVATRELDTIERGIVYKELVQAIKERLSAHEIDPYPLFTGEMVQSQITLCSSQKVPKIVTVMSLTAEKHGEPLDQLLIVFGQNHVDLRDEWSHEYIKFNLKTDTMTIQEASNVAVIDSSLPEKKKTIATLNQLVHSVKTWEEYFVEPVMA